MRKSSDYMMGMAHKMVFKNGVAFDKNSNTYQVKSTSKKNKVYILENKRDLECNCLGYQNRGNCSHCAAVRVFKRTEPKK